MCLDIKIVFGKDTIKPVNWYRDPYMVGIHGEYVILVAEERDPKITEIIEEPRIFSEPLQTRLTGITVPLLRCVVAKGIFCFTSPVYGPIDAQVIRQ